ncbi:hypothetical protein EV702DRAFT_1200600 [Suillus placidus]|uniref:HNH nuclease domain-containing protein n=1 Tax=Suillus placidus TaxID=48579 RepID=A0A9P7CYY2_9AGAM|nr:hypothetical protein EV702DRAFT_1200600 [Suillus placidus]
MPLAHSPSSSTLTLPSSSDSARNNDIYEIMDDETQTTKELVRSARAVLREFKIEGGETPVTQAEPIRVALEVRDCGVRYTASAIIVAHRKGKAATSSSASELTKLAHDWLYLLLWPFKKAYRSTETPHSSLTSPNYKMAQVVTETVSATRSPSFRKKILERDGQRCVVSRVWQLDCGPADSPDPVQDLQVAHILRRSVLHKYDGDKFALPATLDIIKCYANIPWDFMKTVADCIDAPVNGMTLQYTLHTLFDNFAWCLHATDVPETYDVHWFRPVPRGHENFQQVRFQDHSKHGTPLPHPKIIAIHAAVAHVLHLSGAGEVMDKVCDRFFGEGPSVPSGHISSNEDLAFRLALMELTPSNHQLPTVPHGIYRASK